MKEVCGEAEPHKAPSLVGEKLIATAFNKDTGVLKHPEAASEAERQALTTVRAPAPASSDQATLQSPQWAETRVFKETTAGRPFADPPGVFYSWMRLGPKVAL